MKLVVELYKPMDVESTKAGMALFGYKPLNVVSIGAGMILHDQILPALYQAQRFGLVGNIGICATLGSSLRRLRDNQQINEAFLDSMHMFSAYPSFDNMSTRRQKTLYQEVINDMEPRQAVVVALPDTLHYEVVKYALQHDQHVLCVKPFVMKYEQAMELERIAKERGLFVAIEYHKRFDHRALDLKLEYEAGEYGEFVLGDACMIEPRKYRNSNFMNWFTCDKTDAFVYVSCHYTDQVMWITGLRPKEVSVRGKKLKFPNENEGYMWTNGAVVFDNGAMLTVQSGLGYPDQGPGGNDQGIKFFCENGDKTTMVAHLDQRRDVERVGDKRLKWRSPEYFRYVQSPGVNGLEPVGYGVRSVVKSIEQMCRIEGAVSGIREGDVSLERRVAMIREIDDERLIATPANSWVNELLTEAARLSILSEGEWAVIDYEDPSVRLRSA